MSFSGSLDANVLLRFIIGDVESHASAAAEILSKSQHQLAVADMAFAEIVFVMEGGYGMNRKDIATAIEGIMGVAVINCNRSLLSQALARYLENPALSFVDCCLAGYAELNNAQPLYTFDKKLANQLPSAQLLKA